MAEHVFYSMLPKRESILIYQEIIIVNNRHVSIEYMHFGAASCSYSCTIFISRIKDKRQLIILRVCITTKFCCNDTQG